MQIQHLSKLHPELMSKLLGNDLDIFDIMEDLELDFDFFSLDNLILNDRTEIRGAQISFLTGPMITVLYTINKKITLYRNDIKERFYDLRNHFCKTFSRTIFSSIKYKF